MIPGFEKMSVTYFMPIYSIGMPVVIQPCSLQAESQRFTLMDQILLFSISWRIQGIKRSQPILLFWFLSYRLRQSKEWGYL